MDVNLGVPTHVGVELVTTSVSNLNPSNVAFRLLFNDLGFSNDEIARYSRHLIMPEVTLEGQKRLKAASILCIGTGGLGSPIALYLAAAALFFVGEHAAALVTGIGDELPGRGRPMVQVLEQRAVDSAGQPRRAGTARLRE